MMRRLFIPAAAAGLSLAAALLVLAGCSGKTSPYKDASRSAEERADDLLKRMTVEEKLGQLICPLGWPMY
ncbi:MAG: hypothetical protein II408_07190, partial [Bacteroidales bacterium]|nr:hypothetical protein [Bacteroidales bacterium]